MSWRNHFVCGVMRCGQALGLAALLAVGACSGSDSGTSTSGGSSGTSTVAASGTVNTSEIGGSGLKALSFHAEESPIGQDGAFTTTVSLGTTQVLFITDVNGALRGLTLSITTATNATLQVDATSTALGLLFLTPGLLTLDPTEAQARVAQLKAFPSFVTLVQFLQVHLKAESVQELKAGPDFSNLLLACVEEWQASQPAPQQAVSIASLALPTQPTSSGSIAIGSLDIPTSGNFVEETAGLVRVIINGGPLDLRNVPVRIQNKGWRWVRLYRVSRDVNNGVVAPGVLVPPAKDLDPVQAPDLGKIFNGTAYQPTEITDTISFPADVAKVQYWIVGPGLGLNPVFPNVETDMPAQAGHEPHHPVLNKTDYRLGMNTVWEFIVQPFLNIIGVRFKSAEAATDIINAVIDAVKCTEKLLPFVTPGGTNREKLSATVNLSVCIVDAVNETDKFRDGLLSPVRGATGVGILRALTGGLDLGNFFIALSTYLQVPHTALIEITTSHLQFSQATYSVGKTAGSATITVNRVGNSTGTVTVDYATSDGTAKSGEDYTAATGTLTWQPGDTAPKPFVVSVKNNVANTASRTVNLTLKNPIGGGLGDPQAATLTITSDDCPDPYPNITLSLGGPTEAKPVVSYTETNPDSGASMSATGSKANLRLSASVPAVPLPGTADIAARYQDTFIVTSPGKSGTGQLLFSVSGSNTSTVSCFFEGDATVSYGDSRAVYPDGVGGVAGGTFTVTKSCIPTATNEEVISGQSGSFIYGDRHYIEVILHAFARTLFNSSATPSSASSTAGISYSVTVPDDPDAKVTWCRAAP